jgi:hypothetical protein
MPNQFAQIVEEYFEQTLEGFDVNTVISNRTKKYTPSATDMQRAGNAFWRPQPYILQVQDGFETTTDNDQDLIQLSVPSKLSNRGNIQYKLDIEELRDPLNLSDASKAAQMALASHVDTTIANVVANTGSLVISSPNALNWDLVANADSVMSKQGVKMGSTRTLFMDSDHYKVLAGELGQKQYHQGETKSAYDEARLPNVARFKTYESDYTGFVKGSAATGLTLAAAATYTPVATKTSNLGGEELVDNRSMDISLSAAGLQAGDAFTIAGVNAVHHLRKTDTGQLKTFRVVSVNGTSATITPPVIPTGPYQNVTEQGASGADITILNTTSQAPSIFWRDDSVEIINGTFANLNELKGGAQVMTATSTKTGMPIAMVYWFDALTVTYRVKWLLFFGANNLNTEMNGIILANQAQVAAVSAAKK